MNLIDSSGWLEYFANGKNADFFAAGIENTSTLIVSTINIYEVFKKVLAQRGEDSALKAVAVMTKAQVVDVDISISLMASKLSYELKLPMADSLILATAKTRNALLWTQDIDFLNIRGVKYIKK